MNMDQPQNQGLGEPAPQPSSGAEFYTPFMQGDFGATTREGINSKLAEAENRGAMAGKDRAKTEIMQGLVANKAQEQVGQAAKDLVRGVTTPEELVQTLPENMAMAAIQMAGQMAGQMPQQQAPLGLGGYMA